jgi:hypothetical protein
MDRRQFWRLINETRPAEGDSDDHALALIERLAGLEPDEIVSFNQHFGSLIGELDCPSVLAVACMVLGLPSDDSVTYFYGWAILQGKQVVDDLLHSPERVGRHFPPHVVPSCELAGAITMRAYERKTGQSEIPIDPNAIPIPRDEPPLSDDEIRERFPDLWRRFVTQEEG